MPRPGLILLAAGSSSRMGQPKQLLPWEGKTLLRRACETALATDCRPVIVVLGGAADLCRRDVEDMPVTLVVNPHYQRGLGSSVSAGLARLERVQPDCPGALLLLADQPTVTPALLERLIERWSPPAWPIAATLYEQKGGVPALFDRIFFPKLRALEHDRGARDIIAREKARTALVDPGSPLIDLDTPAMYRAAVDLKHC